MNLNLYPQRLCGNDQLVCLSLSVFVSLCVCVCVCVCTCACAYQHAPVCVQPACVLPSRRCVANISMRIHTHCEPLYQHANTYICEYIPISACEYILIASPCVCACLCLSLKHELSQYSEPQP
jgi:hypothetical protein